MTTEEKAKAYDEAIERAKYYYAEGKTLEYADDIVSDIFPELAESEDERIRKGLIEYFLHYPDHEITYYNLNVDFVIAWLEKQGEQKSTLRIDNSRAKVVFPFKAKLKSTGIVVTIYNGQLSRDGKEWIKYQSDKEDGCNVYEPEDLEPVCNVEPKQEWNEEDEDILNTIINHFKIDIECTDEDDVIRWLKSLKERYTWKPSEEQLNALHWCVMNVGSTEHQVLQELLEQLEKLKD